MRLWSLHPEYLDARGLVALWREGLLAQKVLAGKTRGYRHHPQLERFRAARDPLAAVGRYLEPVAREAARRGYRFDARKILKAGGRTRLAVTRGQIRFECGHLLGKLRRRDPARAAAFARLREAGPHPAFRIVPGGVAPWERR